MKTVETADRMNRSLDIVLKREIENFRKEQLKRRMAEQQDVKANVRTENTAPTKVQ